MRDWRLYDDTGRRYTDFYQYDGAAFLGHRPDGVAQTVAAEIDRGLWSAVPTAWIGRFTRAVEALAVVAGVARLAVVAPGVPAPGAAADSAISVSPNDGRQTPDARWRPLTGCADTHVSATVVLPFPLALPTAPGVPLPAPETLSVTTLAGLTRAAWSLVGYIQSREARSRLELAESLPVPPGYRRVGVCYLTDQGDTPPSDLHRQRVSLAGDYSIVLPPHPEIPLCVPGDLSRVERDAWEALCRDWPR